jgi:aspartyl/asparaginyl-tRNA synthetase
MVEPEIAFADLNDNADLAEDLLTNVLRRVLEEREDDMAFFPTAYRQNSHRKNDIYHRA